MLSRRPRGNRVADGTVQYQTLFRHSTPKRCPRLRTVKAIRYDLKTISPPPSPSSRYAHHQGLKVRLFSGLFLVFSVKLTWLL